MGDREGPQVMDTARASQRDHRPQLLHSCGAFLFTLLQKIFSRAARVKNPLGYLAWILSWIASPILFFMKRHWLSTLSFIDNRIHTVETVATTIFPQSVNAFDKYYELAGVAESLPRKIDDVIDRVALLDWASMKEELFRNFSKNPSSSEERESMVDIGGHEQLETEGEPSYGIEAERAEQSGKHLHDKAEKDREGDDDIREVEGEDNWEERVAVAAKDPMKGGGNRSFAEIVKGEKDD